MTFNFNNPVNLDSFFSHFTITPSIDGKFSGDIVYGATQNIVVVKPVPMLKENTTYTITFKKGMTSFSGKTTLDKNVSLKVTITK